VVEVRGRGLLWGIEMESAEAAKRAAARALVQGVLVLAGGPRGRVLQIAPPLVITPIQLDRAIEILEAAMGSHA
jgi:4-aminobutyrate aminotransferase-like enzyme